MKKSLFTLLLLCFLFALLSCTSTKKNNSEVTNTPSFTVSGTLKQGISCFYLSQNPDSKSAVTITLTGTEGHEQTLIQLVDTDVTIKGKLISESSPWKKEVEFISVE